MAGQREPAAAGTAQSRILPSVTPEPGATPAPPVSARVRQGDFYMQAAVFTVASTDRATVQADAALGDR